MRRGVSDFVGDAAIASGKSLWLDGTGTFRGLIKAQETGRQISIKWNASEGVSETFLSAGNPATRLLLGSANNGGDHLALSRSTNSTPAAGAAITWEDLLNISASAITYRGTALARPNLALTWTAAQQFDVQNIHRHHIVIRAQAAVANPSLIFQNSSNTPLFAIAVVPASNRLEVGYSGTNTTGEVHLTSPTSLWQSGGGKLLFGSAAATRTVEFHNSADNVIDLNFTTAANGVLRNKSTRDATAYNAAAALQVDGGAAIAKKLYAQELHANDLLSYGSLPVSTRALSYADIRVLTRPAIYTTSTNGTINVNGTYVGGSGFTTTGDDPYGLATVNNSSFFTLALNLIGDYEIGFQATIARGGSDLLSTVRAGLRFNGVDYGFQQLNVSGNSIILMRVTASKVFTTGSTGLLLRPIFNIVSGSSTDAEIRAADTELKIRYLGR